MTPWIRHAATAVCAWLLLPDVLHAQTASRSNAAWELSGYVALTREATADNGTAYALPAAGQPFLTPSLTISRPVPSWQFGDGALLFNEAAFGARKNAAMVPLDPVMQHALSEPTGVSGGVQVGRQLWGRLSVHASIDYQERRVRTASMDIAEQTRTSFTNGFPQLVPSSASSNLDAQGSTALLTAVTLRLALTHERRIVPHVTAGAAWFHARGEARLTLASRYEIGTGIAELDTVTIEERRTFGTIGVVGVGARAFLGPRWGVIVDGTARVIQRDVQVRMSATPAREDRAGGVTFTTGAIAAVFVSPRNTFYRSSLSAPAIHDGVTFDGRLERYVQTALTIGTFFRF